MSKACIKCNGSTFVNDPVLFLSENQMDAWCEEPKYACFGCCKNEEECDCE